MPVTNATKGQLVPGSFSYHVSQIETGKNMMIENLSIIKNQHLYRDEGFSSFDQCLVAIKEQLNIERHIRTLRRDVVHFDTKNILRDATGFEPKSESISRELAQLPQDVMIKTWKEALQREEPVTSGLIQEMKAKVAGMSPKKNTFTKTFTRVIHDYRGAVAVSGEEREELRLMIVAFLSEIEDDSRIVAAA